MVPPASRASGESGNVGGNLGSSGGEFGVMGEDEAKKELRELILWRAKKRAEKVPNFLLVFPLF